MARSRGAAIQGGPTLDVRGADVAHAFLRAVSAIVPTCLPSHARSRTAFATCPAGKRARGRTRRDIDVAHFDIERRKPARPVFWRLNVLHLEDVTKEYRTDQETVSALAAVSLDVATGEFVALVGRSGCGKTTLLNLAGAMDFPTSGKVLLDGTDTSSLDDRGLTHIRRSKVGFVFQFFHLLPTLTAVENVELPLMLAGDTNGRDRAIESLRWVEMEDYPDRLPHQLSGGQMQRIAVARALVHGPKILLADEPIGNLDTAAAEVVMTLLRRTADERGTTILMATHSMEAAAVTDTVVRLRDGRVEEVKRQNSQLGNAMMP